MPGKPPGACRVSSPTRARQAPRRVREKNWGTWIRTMTNWFRASRATVTPFPKKSAAPLSHSHSRLGPSAAKPLQEFSRSPPAGQSRLLKNLSQQPHAGHSRSNWPRCGAARRVWGHTGSMINPGRPCRRNLISSPASGDRLAFAGRGGNCDAPVSRAGLGRRDRRPVWRLKNGAGRWHRRPSDRNQG